MEDVEEAWCEARGLVRWGALQVPMLNVEKLWDEYAQARGTPTRTLPPRTPPHPITEFHAWNSQAGTSHPSSSSSRARISGGSRYLDRLLHRSAGRAAA